MAMASATLSLSSLRPLAAEGTRPKARNAKRIPALNPKKPNCNLKSQPGSGRPSPPPAYPSTAAAGGGGGGGGGEATTYTRLPPKDDYFFLDHSLALAPGAPREVKLSESKTIPEFVYAGKKPSKLPGNRDGGNIPKGVTFVEEFDEEDEPALEFVEDRLLRLSGSKGIRKSPKDGSVEEEIEEEGDSSMEFVKKKPLQLGGYGGSEENSEGASFVEEMGDFDEESGGFESDDDEVIVYDFSREDGVSDDENEVSDSGFESELDGEFEGFLHGDEEFKEGDVKEKGVPAVMRCFDRAKIYVKAGDGGNGVVAFRREKFVPYGGPSGGDGGRGGEVYVEVDGSMNSLLPFRKNVHFRAGRGGHGQGRKQAGAKGEDVVVKVAPGTVIREARKGGEEGDLLLELVHPGQRALLLPGGRGGRGNASFKSGTNKVPKIAENGEKGAEMWLDLELKLVADVGIVGAPNAGKSTLLSAISAAQPTIANYPFTTLLPNLGVVSLDFDATMVVADLPGLLEGAHRGFGLGHEFLRHTERCSVLVHVVDGSAQQPEYEFDAVRLELELFSPELAEKPFIVAYNKMDLPEANERWGSFKEYLQSRSSQPFCICALNRQGTDDVVHAAYDLLCKEREANKNNVEWTGPVNLNHVADTIQKQRSSSMNTFEIFHDSSSNTWHVVGAGIQRFVQMTNWQYSESLRRFQHALEACGVNKSLIKQGVKEGDTVIVGEMEMVWHDEKVGSSNTRKRAAGSVKWPLS